ncbi:MAG TPA: hypothetical protein VG055_17480 [Planctomycetaceae bacterium]|nr:hypothetical protein [Planctomycetaceae bacterium]
MQRGPRKKKWLPLLLLAVAGLLAFVVKGCQRDTAPTPAELDAMSALQRVRGHVRCDPDGHAVYVDFARVDDVKDAELEPLSKLPYVQQVTFDSASIGDGALQYLEGLKNLARLSLRATRVTDAGMDHLQKCPALTEIDLERLTITDAGLVKLGPLKNLHRVYIGPGGPITTAGIEALKAQIPKVNVSRK